MILARMGRREIRLLYLGGWLGLVLLLSSIRSGPIYGKLDFILLDGRPWWPAWQPIIELVLQERPEKPVLTDPLTSTVLRAVFHQRTVHFRALGRFHLMDIDQMERDNRIVDRSLTVRMATSLLLDESTGRGPEETTGPGAQAGPVLTAQPGYGPAEREEQGGRHPYLCLINMRGFTPTWVAAETHHWQADLADTALYYHLRGLRGPELKKHLRSHPPRNCLVVY